MPCYLFESHGLFCELMNNGSNNLFAGWPYLLVFYLQGPADPDLLKRQAAELIDCLRSHGVETKTGK